MGIVILVLVILAAIFFFKREGYDLTIEQKNFITSIYNEYGVDVKDRKEITKFLKGIKQVKIYPKNKDKLIKVMSQRYPGLMENLLR